MSRELIYEVWWVAPGIRQVLPNNSVIYMMFRDILRDEWLDMRSACMCKGTVKTYGSSPGTVKCRQMQRGMPTATVHIVE